MIVTVLITVFCVISASPKRMPAYLLIKITKNLKESILEKKLLRSSRNKRDIWALSWDGLPEIESKN